MYCFVDARLSVCKFDIFGMFMIETTAYNYRSFA